MMDDNEKRQAWADEVNKLINSNLHKERIRVLLDNPQLAIGPEDARSPEALLTPQPNSFGTLMYILQQNNEFERPLYVNTSAIFSYLADHCEPAKTIGDLIIFHSTNKDMQGGFSLKHAGLYLGEIWGDGIMFTKTPEPIHEFDIIEIEKFMKENPKIAKSYTFHKLKK